MLEPARYVELSLPVVLRKLPAAEVAAPPEVARVLERVQPDDAEVGRRWPGVITSLTSHGAFVHGEPPPLLARVLLIFVLPGHGHVQAIGWTLWRRTADARVKSDGGAVVVPRGFGVIFEWLPEGARAAIDGMMRGEPAPDG